jgi:hypothetical protein
MAGATILTAKPSLLLVARGPILSGGQTSYQAHAALELNFRS